MDMSFLSNAKQKLSIAVIFAVLFTVLLSFLVSYVFIYKSESSKVDIRSKTIFNNTLDSIGSDIFYYYDKLPYANYSADKLKISDIRVISDINSLYTIKKLDNGDLVYLLSSFNGNKDNYEVGTPFDSDIYDFAVQSYSGNEIYTNHINIDGNTSLAAFYPVYDSDNTVIGVIGMEFSAGYSDMYIKYFFCFCIPLLIIFTAVIIIMLPVYLKKNISESLEKNIYTDNLTSLKNRIAYDKKIEEIDNIIKDKKENISISLILSDLSELKETNNSIGDKAGDKYIVDSAVLISSAFSHLGTTYRIGGDEFATITENAQ
ncbi:MAG: diguanylate cyclase, partial [Firmicutes bacterium]|nr:diguanylate cyclase [Bacillota bacterium]